MVVYLVLPITACPLARRFVFRWRGVFPGSPPPFFCALSEVSIGRFSIVETTMRSEVVVGRALARFVEAAHRPESPRHDPPLFTLIR